VVPKTFFLENRGRKPMKITWVRQVKMQKKTDKEKAEAAANKNAQSSSGALLPSETNKDEEDNKFVFSVIPESVVLNPKMGI
jgi:hypothetical protein